MTLTPEREQEIRERVARATEGPWNTHLVDDTCVVSADGTEVCTTCDSSQTERDDGYNIEYERMEKDAAFIAHARQDIPDLLAEIDRLNANLRTVQNAAKTLAAAQGSELEHRRQNANYDHKLRSEHDSLIERDAIMTAENERLSAALTAAKAENERLSAQRDALAKDHWILAEQALHCCIGHAAKRNTDEAMNFLADLANIALSARNALGGDNG